jgi:hypothetical protein
MTQIYCRIRVNCVPLDSERVSRVRYQNVMESSAFVKMNSRSDIPKASFVV